MHQLIVFFSLATAVSCTSACFCGIENVQTRIINGREAQRNRYPWMVSVIGHGGCGGTIINDRYVLTAAHCMNGPNNTRLAQGSVRVILGAHEINERWARSGEFRELDVEWFKVHPDAGTVEMSGANMQNDLALIKLKYPIPFGSELNPICLPNFNEYHDLFSIGWGHYFNGKLTEPKKLQQVEVDEVDTDTCQRSGLRLADPAKQICAGSRTGACSGDSGGPMSARMNGRVYQVGIASFVINACGTQGGKRPDVYVRVTGHLDWIQKETQDAEWCDGPATPDFKGGRIMVAGQRNRKPVPAPVTLPNDSDFKFFTVPLLDGNPPFIVKVHKSNLNKNGPTRLKVNIHGKNLVLVINN